MTAPMTPEELLEIAAAGVRHAVGISAQLERSDWMPCRAHIEQARNTIQKLAGLLVDGGLAQQPWQPIDAALPVDDWPKEIDERVLIYVVHEHAQYEPDPAIRLAEWEGWCVGYWTDFGKGGWVWHGMLGTVTHVAALLPPPSNQGASK